MADYGLLIAEQLERAQEQARNAGAMHRRVAELRARQAERDLERRARAARTVAADKERAFLRRTRHDAATRAARDA